MKQRVFFFDLLRCVAAVAVVAIHVLWEYRTQLGMIPESYWMTAVSVNSAARWAVPVFIMITGALMLSDTRPFDLKYYLHRRLGKVLIPFIVWSLFYVWLSGWGVDGFDAEVSKEVLSNSWHHETYYHLGFFYYFIPLYLVIPFYQIFVRHASDSLLYAVIAFWLITTTLFLFFIDGPWSNQYYLFSGYLLLGYVCYKKVPLTLSSASIATLLGLATIVLTAYMVISMSLSAFDYVIGRWLSYKTINTIVIAMGVFMLCRYVGESLSDSSQKVVGFISQHSLGIYLLHPIFLWPMKNYYTYNDNPLWVIPLGVIAAGSGALCLSWLLSRSPKTRWLVP